MERNDSSQGCPRMAFPLSNGAEKIQGLLVSHNINPRPLAGPGVWLLFLLPLAVVAGHLKANDVSYVYEMSSALSWSLLLSGIVLLLAVHSSESNTFHTFHTGMIFPFLYTCLHFYIVYERGAVFSICAGLVTSYVFSWGLVALMHSCPLCFTFGEAASVTQAVILFLFSCLDNVHNVWSKDSLEVDTDIATIILQVGLLGVCIICAVLYIVPQSRTAVPFYALVLSVLSFGVIPTLHLLLGRSPVLWILFLILSKDMMWLVGYWLVCVGLAVLAVVRQIGRKQRASTTIRKYFHILAVAVFVPGLAVACCFLYLATGVVLAAFIVLELTRLLCIPPLGQSLQEGFAVYADEKDAGSLALTPMYLLAGCALPLWLHPTACASPSSMLPLLSGLLAIGIGDTLASSIGSRYGKHKWPGSSKTVEGTVACAAGQMGAVVLLAVTDVVQVSEWMWLKLPISIAATSLVEAHTDQSFHHDCSVPSSASLEVEGLTSQQGHQEGEANQTNVGSPRA